MTSIDADNSRLDERQAMVATIIAETRATSHITGRSKLNERVIEAMGAVPRHRFVSRGIQANAYLDSALPIACSQSISQPFIVALMTDLLDTGPDDRVLEVGTGSGYQAAVLAGLVKHVYSIELLDRLAVTAETRLRSMGYDNVTVTAGDGRKGWPEYAPFDGIIVTAVAESVPVALKQQLKIGGTLVIPLGSGMHQILTTLKRRGPSDYQESAVLPVSFVPLKHQSSEETI